MRERTFDQRALLPTGDAEDDSIDGGGDGGSFDAAEDRAGVDEDDVEMLSRVVDQATKRRRGERGSMMEPGRAAGKNRHILNIGFMDVVHDGTGGHGIENAVG